MSLIDLFSQSLLRELEQDTIASVGVSLSRNKKIVTARTVKSVRAVTVFNTSDEVISIETYGGEGLPYIMTDKPANTKYPLDFVGTETGPTGRTRKVFELKPRLKDWKTVIGFGGSDFLLARSIAEKPRKAVDISVEAMKYLSKTATPKVLRAYRTLFAANIITSLEDEPTN